MIPAAVAAGFGIAYVVGYSPVQAVGPTGAPPLQLPSGGLPSSSPGAIGTPVTTRLVIPAAKIDIQVIQGDGVSVPMHLAMHYPGTDQPGGGGNALFYAHAQAGMFQGLYQLHLGDQIEAVRADGTQRSYHVTGFEKVAYNDRHVLDPTAFDEISLLTCTSYDPYTPRFIVIALPS